MLFSFVLCWVGADGYFFCLVMKKIEKTIGDFPL